MGFSLDKVYSEPQTEARKRGLRAFFTQLVLNACWTPVFFGAKMPGVALIVLAALIFTVILTIRNFLKINRIAGLILLPYLAWLCFAFYLNAAYKILNP
jgi:tryptophan-rich sensory protein